MIEAARARAASGSAILKGSVYVDLGHIRCCELLPNASDANKRSCRAAIAASLNMLPRGGHLNTGWKELRDNGLVIVEGGCARLSDLFDPPAPASKEAPDDGRDDHRLID